MKEQIQEMESELERFHKQNTQLELNITELRQKLKATDKELQHERQRVSRAGKFISPGIVREFHCQGIRSSEIVEEFDGHGIVREFHHWGKVWEFHLYG